MENLKALLAVALFIATILFASYDKEQKKNLSIKNVSNKQEEIKMKPDTLLTIP